MEEEQVSSESLYKMLTERIDDWDFSDKHYYTHDPSGISFWVANGILSFRVENTSKIGLGLIEKVRLWFWIKNARRVQLSQRIKATEIK